MKLWLLTSVLLLTLHCSDEGQIRLAEMRAKSNISPVILLDSDGFKKYVLSYPRPYDVVIYFSADSSALSKDLQPQFLYLVTLYKQTGEVQGTNPTFFAKINFSREMSFAFQMFNFNSAPNLVVSLPQMAVMSAEDKIYLQKFKWSISYTDGHVTTHKMLDFVNKRTNKDVIYRPTLTTILQTFFAFIILAVVGVLAYTKLKFLWINHHVWFVASILIFIVCCSGVIYDIIHQVPFVGHDAKTGQTTIFASGNRQQYGAEGLVISLTLTFIGLTFTAIIHFRNKFTSIKGAVVAYALLFVIYWAVGQLQDIYKSKSWYGPSFYPPGDYRVGPLSLDQGNNI